MADNDDNDDQPRGGPRRPASVSWQSLADQADAEDPPAHPRRAAVGRAIGRVLEAVGLKRARDDDGTLLPRKTGRLVALVAAIFIVVVGYSMLHIVPAGNVMVPVTLGHAQSEEGQGLHITLPWPITQVATMSIQTQNYTMSAAPQKGTDAAVLVLGSDGASGTVDATVLYKLNPAQASAVYVNIGQTFGTKFVQPASRACVRAEFENYKMVDAATTQSKAVSSGIAGCIRSAIQPEGIVLQSFQMRQVVLASSVQNSINAKIQAQQLQLSQTYNVQAAVAKASIQRLQALATSQSQQIVACGGTASVTKVAGQSTPDATPNPSGVCQAPLLTEQELEYSYIQALRDLINSSTPPTIVLGGGATPVVQVPVGGSTSSGSSSSGSSSSSKSSSSNKTTTTA